jgi:hypothetical protein
MQILPDRDKVRRYYLNQDVAHVLHNGDILETDAGYRFDGHSTKVFGKWAVCSTLLTALLYFFPLFVLYSLIVLSGLLIVSWILVLLFFKAYDKDIRAALIHDLLIDLYPWHRYTRKFIDHEYKVIMQAESYGLRKRIMPLAVKIAGFIRTFGWREYRGEYNDRIKLVVKVDVI